MKRFAGLFILLVVAALVGAYQWMSAGGDAPSLLSRAPLTLVGKAGSEKMGFLNDPEIQAILKNQYGIMVDARQAGSVEQVRDPIAGLDFLWPASQVNLEYFKTRQPLVKSQDIFNSPIVLYSWDMVTDALIKQKIVELRDGVHYVIKLEKLLDLVQTKKQWKDIGIDQLYGSIVIRSTDPTKSNSGIMFAALVANTLNGGEVVTPFTVDAIIPELKDLFARLGYMENSSGVLFNMFLQQGVGAYPIIVGYENQLLEFLLEHEEALPALESKLRVLYPIPTVWASHPFIAIDSDGEKLLRALQDESIQKLAWQRHGFRAGLMGEQSDLSVLKVVGLPTSIDAVMPTPNATVMERITEALLPEPYSRTQTTRNQP